MLTRVLLAVLATAALAQPPFGGNGDDGSDSNRQRPRPDGQGPPGLGVLGQGLQGGQGQGSQGGQSQRGQQGGQAGQGRGQRQDNGNGMSLIDPQATLLTIISMGPQRPRDHCGPWGDWKEVKCWWPDQNFSSLPQECTNTTYPKKVPQVLQKFIDAKVQEVYSVIQAAYKRRGSPPKCGHCTHSFKCRSRNATSDDDGDDDVMGLMGMMDDMDSDQSPMGQGQGQGQGRRPRPRPRPGKQCKTKEIRPMDDISCDDAKACKVSAVYGGCPAPLFLHKDKMRKINDMMLNGDHEGALDMIDTLQYDDNDGMDDGSMRKKRQSGFGDDSSFYQGYPGMQRQQMQMNGPWQSNDQWTGSSQSRNPFLQWRRQERQMDGDSFGPMWQGQGQGNSFGPMWQGQSQGNSFGPRFDRQSVYDFGSMGYQGGQDGGWDRRPWGPDGDDQRPMPWDWDQRRGPPGRGPWDRNDDRRGPGSRPWDRDDRRESGGRGYDRRPPWDRDDDRRGPGGRGDDRRPPWDRDDDRRGPGGRGDDRRPSWGPDRDDRRPPHHGGRGGSSEEDDRRPWGPGGRGRDDDRRPPHHGGRGGHGDSSEEDDRRGHGGRGGDRRPPHHGGSSEEGPGRRGHDDDRRPPHHGGRGGPDSSSEEDRRGPGGRGGDRRPPHHGGRGGSSEEGPRRGGRRPWGPGQDQDNSEEQENRRPRFGGLGQGPQNDMEDMDRHRGGGGGRGGRGGKGGKAKFIANLLHGTNCVSSGSDCLCCCGGYIPDPSTGDCRALRSVMPQLPTLLDFAMKKDPIQ